MTGTAGELAEALVDLVEEQLLALARGPLPRFELPGLLMGHEVGPDVRADLLFTLGLLHECGRRQIGGIELTEALASLLAGVDGRRTHTFYSYRVAETLGRFGPFASNPLIAGLDEHQRAQVADAADSTEWLELLDAAILPRNYAAVLTRCELARRDLGLADGTEVLDGLLPRVRDLLGGHLDDSNAGIGRYDVYTVDLHLFCEPFADLLGEPWRRGARAALDLVDRVATRDGTAVPWGRSSGILAICHTIELAGLVARHDLGEAPARWSARAALAADGLGSWFRDGWVTAHQHRASDPYRGLDRRLQMTLDCLGKLLDAARGLQLAAGAAIADEDLFPEHDELVLLDADRHAAAWSYRSPHTAFVVPVVGGTTTDYLPAPRNPGLFEAPVGSDLVTGTPLVWHHHQRFAAGGLPVQLDHEPGSLHARYDGFPAAGFLEPGPAGSDGDTSRSAEVFPARREVTWSVEGRTLHVDEHLELDEIPRSIAIQITEAAGRPLRLEVDCDSPHTVATVDVSGLAEYRSCWGELPRLHQVDLQPASSLHLTWSVTPVLRVLSSASDAAYHRHLYAPLADRVVVEALPHVANLADADLAALLARNDVFHLHWPEWLLLDLDDHRRLISALGRAGVPTVWTQHNLIGHDKNPDALPCYAAWADVADLVVHHSEWGRDRSRAAFDFADHARHVVVPHGHWGGAHPRDAATRAEVERYLGLRSGALRLALVGAPRAEKDLELVMRAVARCTRDDLELLVLSLHGDEVVPDDPRIVARPYEMVARSEYDRRMAAFDALVMPFDPDGDMLTTGTVADAVAHGLPTLASDWPFLAETLGAAALVYGATEDDLVAALDALDAASLAAAADAAAALRDRYDWVTVAEQLYAELDSLPLPHH